MTSSPAYHPSRIVRAEIHVGNVVTGRCASIGTNATGVVVDVYIGVRSAVFVRLAEATDAQRAAEASASDRRYLVRESSGKLTMVEGARPLPGDVALAWMIDAYRASTVPTVRRDFRQHIQDAARLGLSGTTFGRRTATVGTNTVGPIELTVETVAGGQATKVIVKRLGEVLNAQSGTWAAEHQGLRQFVGALLVAIDVK
jgi:hypothetical protein